MRTHRRIGHIVGALAAAALFAAPFVEAQTPNLDFTVQTSTNNGKSITPKLSWATTPAATSCTASGATGWTGTKAASGTETLAAIGTTASYTIACQWANDSTALVAWQAPTTLLDGTPLTDLGGFRVLYGTSAANMDQSAYLEDPAKRNWRSPALTAGTWYFGVLAFRTNGLEGPVSNIAPKTITASTSQTRTLEVAVKFPAAPTGLTVQ